MADADGKEPALKDGGDAAKDGDDAAVVDPIAEEAAKKSEAVSPSKAEHPSEEEDWSSAPWHSESHVFLHVDGHGGHTVSRQIRSKLHGKVAHEGHTAEPIEYARAGEEEDEQAAYEQAAYEQTAY